MRSRALSHAQSEAGWTLIELLVVIGVVAIVSGILVIGVRQVTESFRLRAGASLIASELRRARDAAVSEGVMYTVEFLLSSAGVNVYRPAGRPVGTVVAGLSSESDDTRQVTLESYTASGAVTTTITLNGTGEVMSAMSLLGLRRASVSTGRSDSTITLRAGSGGEVIATIPPNATVAQFSCPPGSALDASSSWCVRTIGGGEWPSGITLNSAGTSFLSCTSPGGGSNKCVSFTPFGNAEQPDDTDAVQLCSGNNVPLLVGVDRVTGRVWIDRAGTCP